MILGKSSPSWLPSLMLAVMMLSSSSSVVSALDLVCPRIGLTDSGTRLNIYDPNGQSFTEISGSGLSSIQTAPSGEPVLFVVNDRGGGARLGVYDSGNGIRLKTLRLDVLPSSNDWESMAIGSCGDGGNDTYNNNTCIYIADVGNNGASASQATYRIYKIREPILENFQDNDEIPAQDTDFVEFNYFHASSPTDYADCEAVFLDHTGWGGGSIGDLYLVTKWSGQNVDKTRLYHIPTSAWASPVMYSPAVVGTYVVGTYNIGGDLVGKTWTRADMTLDGTLIALGTVHRTFLFPRCPGTSVAEALTGAAEACYDWENPLTTVARRYETFAWTPDGARNLQIAESDSPPLGWTTMDYSFPATTISCPAMSTEEESSSSPVPSLQPSNSPSVSPSMVPTVSESSLNPTMTSTLHPTMAPTVVASSSTQVPEETSPPTVPPTEAPDSTETTVPLEESTPQVSSAASFSTTAPLAIILIVVWFGYSRSVL